MNSWWNGMTYDPAVKKVNDLMAGGVSREEAVKMVQGGNPGTAQTGAVNGANSRLGPWSSWMKDQYNDLFPSPQSANDLTHDPAVNRVNDLMGRGVYHQDAERMVNVPVGFTDTAQRGFTPALNAMGGQPLGEPNTGRGFAPAFDGMVGQVSPAPAALNVSPAPAALNVSPVQATAPRGSGTDSALGRLLARQARLNRDQGGNLGQVTSGSNLAGLAHLFNSYVRGKDDRKRSAELESVDREVYAKLAEKKRREEALRAARREALLQSQGGNYNRTSRIREDYDTFGSR